MPSKSGGRRGAAKKTGHKAEIVLEGRREAHAMVALKVGLGPIPEPDLAMLPIGGEGHALVCSPAETTAYVQSMLDTLYARGGPTAQFSDAHARHDAISAPGVVAFGDVVAAYTAAYDPMPTYAEAQLDGFRAALCAAYTIQEDARKVLAGCDKPIVGARLSYIPDPLSMTIAELNMHMRVYNGVGEKCCRGDKCSINVMQTNTGLVGAAGKYVMRASPIGGLCVLCIILACEAVMWPFLRRRRSPLFAINAITVPDCPPDLLLPNHVDNVWTGIAGAMPAFSALIRRGLIRVDSDEFDGRTTARVAGLRVVLSDAYFGVAPAAPTLAR